MELPVVDLGRPRADVAAAIDDACRTAGFFAVVGHGIDDDRLRELDPLAREFFALDDDEKAGIAMARGGRAWRGWFPVGGELTSGTPDGKEGIYFGRELGADDPRVRAGVPLHGPNLFPRRPAGLRDAVLTHVDDMTALGHRLCAAMATALGLDEDWFDANLTADPTILFRIFHYPPGYATGVGEHTDYGLLTLLVQDDAGGLEIRTDRGWIDVPPRPDTIVCNLGDMLERMTGGRYRSTPHRVRNRGATGRVSSAFFFDPSWDARVGLLPGLPAPPPAVAADAGDRWDGTSVHQFDGTYGDYLTAKVRKVFPALFDDVLKR